MCFVSVTSPAASVGGGATGTVGADGKPTATVGVQGAVTWQTKTYIGKCSDSTLGTEVGSSTPPALPSAAKPSASDTAASPSSAPETTSKIIPAVNKVTEKLIKTANHAKTEAQKSAAVALLADSVEFYKAVGQIKNPEPYGHSTPFNQAVAELESKVAISRATKSKGTPISEPGTTSEALLGKFTSERFGIKASDGSSPDSKPMDKKLRPSLIAKAPSIRPTAKAVLKKADELLIKAEQINPH
jgi:hypothetical protein